MVQVRPFVAIRPSSHDVDQVASLPYDVVTAEEVRALTADNEKSYLHVDRPEVDLAADIPIDSDLVYEQARENLDSFLKKGWLIQDEEPAYYIYRLKQLDRVQYGFVATIAVDDYLSGAVKRHEFTRPDKERDRIRHNDVTDANTSPIFLTMKDNQTLSAISEDIRQQVFPIYSFDSFNQTNHCIWKISDPEMIQVISDIFEYDVDALYIADGHHRMESASKVAKKRRQAYPQAPEDAEFNYFLGVIFPESDLTILPYNRIVEGSVTEKAWDKVKEAFTVEPITKHVFQPSEPGTFGMCVGKKWYKLTIRPEKVPNHPVDSLDASLLQKHILEPVFGIVDPRRDQRIEFVGGIHPLEELMNRTSFDHVAFSMYPTTMDQLLSVADSGEVMPPKSTWFEPKLLSGLFIHALETEKYAHQL